ncbi:PQQ-binding-like beta-propeller repeat protein [Cereibacter sp. SYSU M97828]|nr:PQQ-binding-like beta-propeller repeat protein [Cereibacter flavus]
MKKTTGFAALATLTLLAACEKEPILPGERFDVRAPLSASIPTTQNPTPRDGTGQVANRAVAISLPATSTGSWTHRGGNAQHIAPHGALSAQPARVWSVDFGAGNSRRQRIAAAPVVADGRIFAMDADSRLAAVSTGGQLLWTAPLKPADEGRRTQVSGGGIAYGGGRVFASTGYGEVIALDPATGAVAWRQSVGAPVTGAPTFADGTVYAVGRDGTAWAIDASNGRVRWTLAGTAAVAGMIGTGSPAIAGGNVILPFSSGELAGVLRQSGLRQWSSAVAGQRRGSSYNIIQDITGDPVVDGAVTYVGNQAGRTVAISTANGERIWMANEGAYGPVVPVGGSVFLISDEAHLVRLDAASGETIWSVPMPYFETDATKKRRAITAHYGPVLVGGRIAVASSDGQLRFFSPTNGALVGTTEIPGGAGAQPAVAGGALYVVSTGGQIHAFR